MGRYVTPLIFYGIPLGLEHPWDDSDEYYDTDDFIAKKFCEKVGVTYEDTYEQGKIIRDQLGCDFGHVYVNDYYEAYAYSFRIRSYDSFGDPLDIDALNNINTEAHDEKIKHFFEMMDMEDLYEQPRFYLAGSYG